MVYYQQKTLHLDLLPEVPSLWLSQEVDAFSGLHLTSILSHSGGFSSPSSCAKGPGGKHWSSCSLLLCTHPFPAPHPRTALALTLMLRTVPLPLTITGLCWFLACSPYFPVASIPGSLWLSPQTPACIDDDFLCGRPLQSSQFLATSW